MFSLCMCLAPNPRRGVGPQEVRSAGTHKAVGRQGDLGFCAFLQPAGVPPARSAGPFEIRLFGL